MVASLNAAGFAGLVRRERTSHDPATRRWTVDLYSARRKNASPRPRRGGFTTVEALERRELLAWSGLYQSLPDLTIQGYAAPVAAYGGQITVNAVIDNLGANTFPSYNQSQTAVSTADAPPSQVTVYLGRSPHWPTRVIELGSFETPAIPQKTIVQVEQTLDVPERMQRFLPPSGGTAYLFFRVDLPEGYPLPDFDPTNNVQRKGVPVQIAPNLPDLYAISLEVPGTMQAGDAIQPTIKLANYGTANPADQGPFDVLLVASTDKNFGPGDRILERFTVRSVPSLADVPIQGQPILGDVNINDPVNIISLTSTSPITLPDRPELYNLGVIVDPDNQIREINEVGRPPSSQLNPIKRVGPRQHGLTPARVVGTPAPLGNRFPTPPFGAIDPPIVVDTPSREPAVGEVINVTPIQRAEIPGPPARFQQTPFRNLNLIRKNTVLVPFLERETRTPISRPQSDPGARS